MAFIDTLHLESSELDLITARYPACHIKLLSNTSHKIQKYQIEISCPNELIDTYFEFLTDSGISMSSSRYAQRICTDSTFREEMIGRSVRNKA